MYEDLTTTAPAVDMRPLPPSVLVTELGLSSAAADELADEIGQRLLDFDLVGRPLWRESYSEKLPGPGGIHLLLSRWPVVSDPEPVVTTVNGDTVDADGYETSGVGGHILERAIGWARTSHSSDRLTGSLTSPASSLYYIVAYTAGYLMPGQVADWSASLSVQVDGSTSYGELPGWVRAPSRRVSLRFEVTTTGVMDAGEPTWPTVIGDTVASGTAVLTAREARELPPLQSAFLRLATYIQATRKQRPDLESEKIKDHELVYGGADSAATLSESFKVLK